MSNDIKSILRAIISSALILSFDLLPLWFVRFKIGVQDEATYIALLVLPALLFLISI